MSESLYDFAGGMPAMLALAHAQNIRCLADPELNHPFSHPGHHPQHVERLAGYLAEAMGGPSVYSAGLGDHSGMLRMHSGNGDMGDLGRRFVDCFTLAAEDAGLPPDPAFRAALRDNMQRAVDEVLLYPDDPDEVASDLPMPRWTWDGPDGPGLDAAGA